MKRPLLALCLALFTSACVPGLKPAANGDQGTSPAVSTNALATEAISAEPLGTGQPLPAAIAAPDAAPFDALDLANIGDLAAQPPKPRPEDLADATPETATPETATPDATPDPTPTPEVAPEPKAPASPEEAACLRKGGLWIRAGRSIAMTCIKITKDAGKSCQREQDCQGQCLARSMTCAPYDPLFGCNEVLQNDGVRVTLCID